MPGRSWKIFGFSTWVPNETLKKSRFLKNPNPWEKFTIYWIKVLQKKYLNNSGFVGSKSLIFFGLKTSWNCSWKIKDFLPRSPWRNSKNLCFLGIKYLIFKFLAKSEMPSCAFLFIYNRLTADHETPSQISRIKKSINFYSNASLCRFASESHKC